MAPSPDVGLKPRYGTGATLERLARDASADTQVLAILDLANLAPERITPDMVRVLEAARELGADLRKRVRDELPRFKRVDGLDNLRSLMRQHPEKRRGTHREWPREVMGPWFRLCRRTLAPLGKRWGDAPLVSELTPEMKELLVFGVQNRLYIRFGEYGLDFAGSQYDLSASSWRRYLGMTQPGPLERALSVGRKTLPTWKWFHLLYHGRAKTASIANALRKQLTARQIVDLSRDATYLIYVTPEEGQTKPSPRSELLLALLEELGSRARAHDLDGIRSVLSNLAERRRLGMWLDRWEGGPWVGRSGRSG